MIKEVEVHTIGERVEKECPDCKELLGHVVKSVTKLGKISRVTCSKCGKVGTYKRKANAWKIKKLEGKKGSPYDMSKTYKTGQVMDHSTFGVGEVLKVPNSKMIDVLFMDRVRRLVHSRDQQV